VEDDLREIACHLLDDISSKVIEDRAVYGGELVGPIRLGGMGVK
jgi:hypothetical protein